ncbi:3521_t:CDS:2 [Paraglomus occultum]|uniref:3521_t:CDS:1 n=1 Tax=Paraglomus occultum TaxID=144539 RepID=A0A9N8ZS06_9GLOM|nr:3521_t:CDS:2 [Paraglomus occultum]
MGGKASDADASKKEKNVRQPDIGTSEEGQTSEKTPLQREQSTASMEDVGAIEIPKPSVEEVEKWKRNDVTTFLNTMKESLDLDDEDIQKITDQKVAGQAFLRLTAEKLMQDGLSRGPAESIAGLIDMIKGGKEQDAITKIHEIHNKLTQPTVETISISKINTENFQLLKSHLNLKIDIASFNILIHNNMSSPAFEWENKTEPARKDEYLEWLHQYIPLTNPLVWHDVGGNHDLLDVYNDTRLPYNVHGGTDVVVADKNGIASHLIPESIYAVLELKKRIERKHVMQTIMEMVVADLITSDSRTVFGILSDLRDDWQLFWLEEDRKIKNWKAPNRNVAVQVISTLLSPGDNINMEDTSIIIPAAKRVKLDTLLPNKTISEEDDIARMEDVYDVMSKEEIWRHKVGVALGIVRNIPSFSSMYA